MNRSVSKSRLLCILLLAVHAAMLFGAGSVLHALASAPGQSPRLALVILVLGMLAVVRALVLAQLPSAVSNAHWLLLRPMVLFELSGLGGLIGGLMASQGLLIGWPLLIISAALVGLLAFIAARGDQTLPRPPARFFLFARGHFDDWSARRHLGGYALLAFLTAALMTLIIRSAPESVDGLPEVALKFAAGLAMGLFLPFAQMNSLRGASFFPHGLILLSLAALIHAIWPESHFAALLLGFAAGMPVPGVKAALMMLVPPRQRFIAGLMAQLSAAMAGLAGAFLALNMALGAGRWIMFALTILATAFCIWLYFREFAEIITEIAYWPLYRFTAKGPGLYHLPTRGPMLIIANHAAYFDPLFLAKVLPLRVRAMMISTMFDKPFLKWLAGDVYGAIRVPDAGAFRRDTPELDEAIAALKRGEVVMIFPEGWLRRREEKPLHRFAQGVYRILKEVPDTPVLPCWIEGSWGSYLSYKNGPPTVNKKFDWWFPIRLGIGEPVMLTPEQLDDHRVTRRYLMELVLHARTHLGLPAYPMPDNNADEKNDA